MRILKDTEIEALISEPKALPENWRSQLQLKEKRNFQHQEGSMEVAGERENKFRVILRRNRINQFDFSIILTFLDEEGGEYRLLRYNGKHSSEHTNKWEKEQGKLDHTFGPVFHIHRATERYQSSGYPIDGFAEITSSYHDFPSALRQFLKDTHSKTPQNAQGDLFEGGFV